MPSPTRIVHRRIYQVAPRDLERAGTVSTAVRQELLALGMAPDVVRRASVICFEGEMNLVLYASRGGRVILVVRDDRVELLFSDDGPGIADVELASQPGYSTAPDWARELGFGAGMGITNMEQNSDLFKIRSRVGEGTVVRATILLGIPFF